jgi:flagellar biosynthesis protein FlhA
LSSFVKVLQNLLAEGVPLRDMRTILETISEGVATTKEQEALTAMVRIKLGRLIVQEANQAESTLEVLTLDPSLEQLLSDLVRSAANIEEVALEPNLSESFFSAISESIKQLEENEKEAVLVVSPIIRPWLAKLLRRASQEVRVLSYREVPDDQSIKIIQTIELEEKPEDGVEE